MKKLIREGRRLEYEIELLLEEVEEWFACDCGHAGKKWFLAVTRLGTVLLACPKCEEAFIHSPS